MRVSASLRMSQTTQPTLAQFWQEQQLWEKLGIPAKPLDDRPWQEAAEYEEILQLTARHEAAQRRHTGR